jgi:hypothetical protein
MRAQYARNQELDFTEFKQWETDELTATQALGLDFNGGSPNRNSIKGK